MTNIPILDLVVGLIFIYFLLSIISSSVVEMIMSAMQVRAEILRSWLLNIFNKNITQPDGKVVPLGQAIMDHCGITALSGEGKAPSYIEAKNFTSALLEKITYAADPNNVAGTIDEMMASIKATNALPTDLQRVLLTYANEAKQTYAALTVKTASEVDLFKTKIDNWYNSNMDRITGNLKQQYARPFTLIVAIVTTLLLNADSISIAQFLYGNPQVTEQLAAQAMTTAQDSTTAQLVHNIGVTDTVKKTQEQLVNTVKSDVAEIKAAQKMLSNFIPLGWSMSDFQGDNWFLHLLARIPGWAMTVFAIVMGAPFWFDLLNKIANLRSSGAKPSTAQSNDTSTKTS